MKRIVIAVVVIGGLLIARWLGVLPRSSDDTPQRDTVAVPYQNPNLNAVLWTQSSAEFVGSALQAYAAATAMLERALADPSWTAALEQQAAGGYEQLAPAVILDVDETVLDNSPNQVRQILDAVEFNRPDWHAWVREEQATAVPGALEFTRYAAERGVRVFYVTNRRHEVEDATRNNLAAVGFPLDPEMDTILTRDEEADWGSDKGTRRQRVAAQHRILLLIGDNLGDFMSDVDRDVASRDTMTREHTEYWGRRWIVLPNPQYGSWEGSVIGFRYALPTDDKGRIKLDALDARR